MSPSSGDQVNDGGDYDDDDDDNDGDENDDDDDVHASKGGVKRWRSSRAISLSWKRSTGRLKYKFLLLGVQVYWIKDT